MDKFTQTSHGNPEYFHLTNFIGLLLIISNSEPILSGITGSVLQNQMELFNNIQQYPLFFSLLIGTLQLFCIFRNISGLTGNKRPLYTIMSTVTSNASFEHISLFHSAFLTLNQFTPSYLSNLLS